MAGSARQRSSQSITADGSPVVADQQVTEVEVSVCHREAGRRRQRFGLREDLFDRRRGVPEAEVEELGHPRACARHAEGHVRAAHRVEREGIDALELEQRRVVERAQEPASAAAAAPWAASSDAASRCLVPGRSGVPKNGHRKSLVRAGPTKTGWGIGQRQKRRESREQDDLPLAGSDGDLPPRKAEDPALVDEPDGVVPAFAEQSQRPELELRELHIEHAPHERGVDRRPPRPTPRRARLEAAGGRLHSAVRSCRVSGAPIVASRRRRAGALSPPTMRPTSTQWSRRRSVARFADADRSVTLLVYRTPDHRATHDRE